MLNKETEKETTKMNGPIRTKNHSKKISCDLVAIETIPFNVLF